LPETFYRPGLVFKAKPKSQGHEECCRRYVAPVYTPDGAGVVREEIPALWAEFGVHGGEFTYVDPLTDRTEVGSEFRGGYFNLDVQAADKGWSDTDKEIVARHMLRLANSGRGEFTLYSAPKAQAPWPTYDATHHNQIATLAATLGLVAESLVYEEQNKNRATVVEKLREELAKAQAEAPQDDSDLVAV
jgi:hypothetical protein